MYWHQIDGKWKAYTLQGLRDIQDILDEPVRHVTFYEATAFAFWKGFRLPTEFE